MNEYIARRGTRFYFNPQSDEVRIRRQNKIKDAIIVSTDIEVPARDLIDFVKHQWPFKGGPRDPSQG